MDRYTLEAIVDEIYGRAGADPCAVVRPSRLARALGLLLVRVPGQRPRGLYDGHRIAVRAGLPRAIEEWTIGHELGHWAGLGQDDEASANYVGAALQMPRRAFLRALAERPDAWHELGPLFGATSTSAAIRAAELEDRALAVVTPGRVYPRLIHLPDPEIRRLARDGGPGLSRTRLEDDPRRIVLEAIEIDG